MPASDDIRQFINNLTKLSDELRKTQGDVTRLLGEVTNLSGLSERGFEIPWLKSIRTELHAALILMDQLSIKKNEILSGSPVTIGKKGDFPFSGNRYSSSKYVPDWILGGPVQHYQAMLQNPQLMLPEGPNINKAFEDLARKAQIAAERLVIKSTESIPRTGTEIPEPESKYYTPDISDLETEIREKERLFIKTIETRRRQALNSIYKNTETPTGNEESIKTYQTQIEKILPKEFPNRAAILGTVLKDLETNLQAYGTTAANVSVKSKILDEGQLKLALDFNLGETGVVNYTRTFDALGNVITKTTSKVKEFTAEQLGTLKADPRLGPAFNLAQQADPRFKLQKTEKIYAGTGVVGDKMTFGFLDSATNAWNDMTIAIDKSGRMVTNVSRSFRSFGQSVIRDISELAKWTIAIGVIYVPLRKLQELVKIMVEQESKLADAAIAVSSSTLSLAQIFDIATEAANAAGESITGVIDGFTLAYRATGNLGSEQERLSAAVQLTSDSLILSKLSTLDQATAIDTLSASLRQTGMGLDQGAVLLDKWVRVTQVANVDLATLATGFAVLGDSADSAGLSIDELNGLIAAIAETGIASGREAANQARAIVSGFQSERAAKELESYGIAVKDATGQLRPFMNIMKEIYEMKQAGIINKQDLAEITLALGGGTRRQAVYTTFIENLARVNQVAEESKYALSGTAELALAKKLDNVQTSLTKLANAFSSLAMSLGQEGGLLDVFKFLVDVGTTIVTVIDKLTAALGKAGPVLATTLVAFAAIRNTKALTQSKLLGMATSAIAAPIDFFGGVSSATTAPLTWRQMGMRAAVGDTQLSPGTIFANKILGGGNLSSIVAGILVSALPAISNFSNAAKGEDKYGTVKGIADIAGGIIGAGIATALAGPGAAIIGGAVGTAIAETFTNLVVQNIPEIAEYGRWNPPPKVPTTEDEIKKKAEENLNIAAKNLLDDAGLIKTWFVTWAAKEAAETIRPGVTPPTTAEMAYSLASPEMQAAYDAAKLAAQNAGLLPKETTSAYMTQKQTEQKELYGTQLSIMGETAREDLVKQLQKGEITLSEFTGKVEQLAKFQELATGFFAAFGQSAIDSSSNINDASDAYQAFLDILMHGTPEDIQTLTVLKGQIRDIYSSLEEIQSLSPGQITSVTQPSGALLDMTKEEAIKMLTEWLTDVLEESGMVVAQATQNAQYNRIKFPRQVGNVPIPESSVAIIEQRARAIMEKDVRAAPGVTPENFAAIYKEFEERAEEFMVTLTDGAKEFKDIIEGITPEAWQQSIDELTAEGAIPPIQPNVGFQTFDVPQAQFEQLIGTTTDAPAYLELLNRLMGMGYKPDYQTQIGIFQEGIVGPMTKDWKIVQYLLQQLVDIGQKELDGMYNLPEGSSFWIRLTKGLLSMGGGGGGGVAEVPEITGGGEVITTPETETKPTVPYKFDPKQWVDINGHMVWFSNPDLQPEQPSPEIKMPHFPSFTEPPFEPVPTMAGLTPEQIGAIAGAMAGAIGTIADTRPIQTKLSIEMSSHIQLVVDGRVLADALSPYSITDMITSEGQNATTHSYVM